jgi:hypothetical protein
MKNFFFTTKVKLLLLLTTIKDLLNSCGIKNRVEVAECFRVADLENNQRPDLMLYNAPDFNKPVVADVCITCPIPVAASAPSVPRANLDAQLK